jgi:hypothetical protein
VPRSPIIVAASATVVDEGTERIRVVITSPTEATAEP